MRKNRWLITLAALLALLGTLVIGGCGGKQETPSPDKGETPPAEPKSLVVGASATGSTGYTICAGWANVIAGKMKNLNLGIEVTGGVMKNIQLIEQGSMDLGISMPSFMYEGWEGLGWANGQQYREMRAILPLFMNRLHVYTLKNKGIKTMQDLNGKNVSVGSAGASNEIVGRQMLECFGIKPKNIFMLPGTQTTDGIKDGTVDVGFATLGLPGPMIVDLNTTHQISLVGLTDQEFETFKAKHPQYALGVIPKGTYGGVDEDIPNIVFWNMMMCDKDMPDDLIYEIVKTTFENAEEIAIVHPALAEGLKPENILESTIPIHPGAARYFSEVGINIPSNLLQ